MGRRVVTDSVVDELEPDHRYTFTRPRIMARSVERLRARLDSSFPKRCARGIAIEGFFGRS